MSTAFMDHFGPILHKAEAVSFAKGKAQGIKKGIEEGREKQITLAVLNGFKEGYSISSIAKVNGISIEKVEEILLRENSLT